MAYTTAADDRHDLLTTAAKPKNRRGFFRCLFDAVVESRQCAAEREIAAYLQSSGQFLTDEAEREIERILSSSARL